MLLNDLKRIKRLGRYLTNDKRTLYLIVIILIPVAFAGAIQPLLVGQAISILKNAGIELGVTYPEPVIELKESREKALSAFEKIKKNRDVQFNFNSW